jgi:hypothetical protein
MPRLNVQSEGTTVSERRTLNFIAGEGIVLTITDDEVGNQVDIQIDVGGTVQTTQVPSTSGGLDTYHVVSAASTNADVVKASAGQLFGYYIYNANASARKVAFHDSASTPTAGASVAWSVVLPGGSAANVEWANGVEFDNGIAITTVTEVADSGTTAVGAGDLDINLFYK